MKTVLSYDDLVNAIPLAEMEQQGYDEVIAVMRGGMTAAHFIAKQLRLKCGAYFPSSGDMPAMLVTAKKDSKKLLFVEDLIAQGRTFNELEALMAETDYQWHFYASVIDITYDQKSPHLYEKTPELDWIVFPYEKEHMVKEGDRGLFRNGSDDYGR